MTQRLTFVGDRGLARNRQRNVGQRTKRDQHESGIGLNGLQ